MTGFSYEAGKFLGDSAGFPRLGIVNKDTQLILDTNDFLAEKFNTEPVI